MITALLLASVLTGTAKFEADSIGGLVKIESTGCQVEGDVASGKYVAKLATCKDTGFDLRDKHTKEKYLEVGKFPTAELTLAPLPANTSGTFDWQGTLSLKGRAAPVSGKATVAGAKVQATFTVNLDTYPEVGAPSYKGIAVNKEIRVTVEGEVK